jgi:nucleoside-diphosphate-sugar epimerase
MRVLITAASGALGSALARHLIGRGIAVTAATRGDAHGLPNGVDHVVVGRIDGSTNWSAALCGVTHIVHAAAQTQLLEGESKDAYLSVNRDGTRNLAEQATMSGVRRFVQISSAAVNGRVSGPIPITALSKPAPANAYARSKLEAEAALWGVSDAAGLEVSVIRPPRILWSDLTGNLRLFERLIAKGIPLPFGLINKNARDNVSPESLIKLIDLCLESQEAVGGVFFATDEDPLSTRELALRLGARVGKRPWLVPVPIFALRAIVALMPDLLLGRLNRKEMLAELLEDFRLDIAPAKSLGWTPSGSPTLPPSAGEVFNS